MLLLNLKLAVVNKNLSYFDRNYSLGKTLAYVIPIIHQIQMIEPLVRRETGPIAIVLVPTKEVKDKKI
jgi:hypothetical protein